MTTHPETTSEPISEKGPGSSKVLERSALLVLVLGMLLSLFWLVHGWYDPTNDGAMYVLTGRSLLAGEGYSMLGIPFRIRPPGFSLLIAPILALRGTDFGALHLFVSLWGVAGCALLFLWAKTRLGWPLAWLTALLVWMNPGYQLLCNQPMSDVPGTTLLMACLLLERWAAHRPGWKRDLGLGLFIAATAYIRSINVLLVPAILGVRLLRRFTGQVEERSESWRSFLLRAGTMGLAVFLVQLPWNLRNEAVAPEPPADQTLLYSYSSGMWNVDMGDPNSPRYSLSEVLGRFPQRGTQAVSVLGNRMKERTGVGVGDEPYAYLFLASALIIFIKRRASAELFVLGSMALISIYFGFAPRLLLPIMMLTFVSTAEVIRDVVRLGVRRFAGAKRAGLAGTTVASAGVLALLVMDAEPRKGWDKIEIQNERMSLISQRFTAGLKEEDVVASHRAWHYAVLMDRPIYALEFVIKRNLDAEKQVLNTDPLEALIDKYGITAVVLSPIRRPDMEIVPYFKATYGPQPDPLAHVYRVR